VSPETPALCEKISLIVCLFNAPEHRYIPRNDNVRHDVGRKGLITGNLSSESIY
jgi:hypothetical protein